MPHEENASSRPSTGWIGPGKNCARSTLAPLDHQPTGKYTESALHSDQPNPFLKIRITIKIYLVQFNSFGHSNNW